MILFFLLTTTPALSTTFIKSRDGQWVPGIGVSGAGCRVSEIRCWVPGKQVLGIGCRVSVPRVGDQVSGTAY